MKLEYHSAVSPHQQHLKAIFDPLYQKRKEQKEKERTKTHNTRKGKNKEKERTHTLTEQRTHSRSRRRSHPQTIGGRGLSSAAEAPLRSTVLSFSLSLHSDPWCILFDCFFFFFLFNFEFIFSVRTVCPWEFC